MGIDVCKTSLTTAGGAAVDGAGSHGHGTVAAQAADRVFKNVLQKSIPTQIRQLILCIGNSEGLVDGFVGELT